MILYVRIPGHNTQDIEVESDFIPEYGTEIHVATRDIEGYFKVGRVEYKIVEYPEKKKLQVYVTLSPQ